MEGYNPKEDEKKVLISLAQSVRFLMHEIKNPLTAILFQCQLLQDELEIAEIESDFHKSASENISLIEEQAERIKSLISSVNTFFSDARGNDDRIELVGFFKALVNSFSAEIKTNFMVEEAFVVFDRGKLRSVFENLIKNAVESTDSFKEELEASGASHFGLDSQNSVQVVLTQRDNYYIIEVIDRGKGVSPEVEKKLFEPFITTKKHGSGIGLYLAKRYIEARGGSIALQSGENGGAVCTVMLERA